MIWVEPKCRRGLVSLLLFFHQGTSRAALIFQRRVHLLLYHINLLIVKYFVYNFFFLIFNEILVDFILLIPMLAFHIHLY